MVFMPRRAPREQQRGRESFLDVNPSSSHTRSRTPRRPRLAAGDLAYHVLNRRIGRLPLFEKHADYAALEQILTTGHAQTKIRIADYHLIITQNEIDVRLRKINQGYSEFPSR